MRPNKFRINAETDAAAQRDKTMRCFMAMPLFPFALVDYMLFVCLFMTQGEL